MFLLWPAIRSGLASRSYAATKFAVRALSEGVRQEVKPYNIRTTVISLGAVATELLNSITEPDVAETVRKRVEEIALPADSFARLSRLRSASPMRWT